MSGRILELERRLQQEIQARRADQLAMVEHLDGVQVAKGLIH